MRNNKPGQMTMPSPALRPSWKDRGRHHRLHRLLLYGFFFRLPFITAASLSLPCFFSCNQEPQSPRPFTVQARRGDLKVTVSAPGRIVPARLVTVKSKAAGEIDEILVEEGDTVKAGQVLLRLDPEEERARFSRAEADNKAALAAVRQARIQLEQEQSDYDRELALYKDKLVSDAKIESQRRSLELAKSNLEIAKSREKSSAHALDEARDRLSNTEIMAPMDGIVLDLSAAKGQVVSSGTSGFDTGTALLTIADPTLRVVADVEETDVASVRAGQDARVEVDAFPGLVLSARVEQVSPEAVRKGPVTVVEVEISLEELGGALLRPGLNATVEITTASREDALLLPVQALRRRDEAGVVVIRDGDTSWRSLKLGPGDWEMVVVENGLEEGESVVLPPGALPPDRP